MIDLKPLNIIAPFSTSQAQQLSELTQEQQQQQYYDPALTTGDSDRNSVDRIGEFDGGPITDNDFLQSINEAGVLQNYTLFTTPLLSSAASSTATTTSADYYNSTSATFSLYDDGIYGNYTNFSTYNEIPCFNVYDPHEYKHMVEFWVCGICLNLVGVFGILGNIISTIILSRPQMRSSINYLLIGLACCDTVLILTSMLLFGIPSIYPYTGHFFLYYNYIYPFISPFVYPVAMISQTSSVYMTFTVTLERYVAVCHPLKARALCTYGRAKIYFIVCVAFASLYNLPHFWEVITVSTAFPDSPVILHCVRPTALRKNPTYINIYINWCYLIVNYIIPFLTLAILNCLIYRQVKKANRERQRLSRSEKREIGLATMLLCVVIVFFIFNFPALVLNISEAFYNFIDHLLAKISNLLVTINSSCNFLIYVIFGEKFKRIFMLIFFKRRLSRDQPDLIHYESSISNNGDGTFNHRSSGRFSRHGTQRSTTATYLTAQCGTAGSGNTALQNGRIMSRSISSPGTVKVKRNRAPSPGPIVYYPAREMQRSSSPGTMMTMISNNNTPLGCDWMAGDGVPKNGQMTSGF